MAAMFRERDLMVLSDEIYSRIWYEQDPGSIATFDGMAEKTIILDGFSKTYSMTGWRLGYGVMPEWLADAVNKLTVNSNSCTASFTQRAGMAALEGPQDCVDTMVKEFRRRRDAMVKGFNEIPGFRCTTPAGAFYAFPNVTRINPDSRQAAEILLDRAKVSAVPGIVFGTHGEGHLRFSFSTPMETIEAGLDSLRRNL